VVEGFRIGSREIGDRSEPVAVTLKTPTVSRIGDKER
jgi:hypothetical protein